MNSILSIFDKLIGAISSFNFTSDLLDIILVSFVLFELIKLLRGSRTFQLVKGIVFLIAVYGLVRITHMEASEFILSTLFKNGLLILVILFAPEIRKILERMGRQSITDFSFFSFTNSIDYEKIITDTVNSFCKAAVDMSETKTGALVVFEKEALLKDIADSGTLVDARASAELFNGLFFKNSALHDGAVLVREGRIHSAGCILPLTQNTGLASELGTRHRAAIGMSEQSDAVVVVVSEETGAISVAKNGALTRDVTTGELREILLDEFINKEDKADQQGGNKFFGKLFGRKGGSENEKK